MRCTRHFTLVTGGAMRLVQRQPVARDLGRALAGEHREKHCHDQHQGAWVRFKSAHKILFFIDPPSA